MSNKTTLIEDPLWLELCREYQGDIVRFAVEVCGYDLSTQQIRLLTSVARSRSRVSVASGHGCFANGTSIMLSSGQCVPVESIVPGDKLMGPDGSSVRHVLELKRGREPMYRFTYMDGTSHVFNESHILCLVATNSKGRRVSGQKTTVTVREWLTWGYDKKRCHAIYRSGVTHFDRDPADLLIPPYVLGVWLGDGHSKDSAVTTPDQAVKDALIDYAKTFGGELRHGGDCGKAITWRVTGKVFKQGLKELDVWGNKHIPDSYLLASERDRLELLAGLLDADGHLDRGGACFDFVQKREILAKQTAWLARSLGCHATIKKVSKKCCNNGVVGEYWRVTIGRNLDRIPVRVERRKPKKDMPRQRNNLHFGIKSCEPLGEGDYYGFTLDGDNRFLGGDFTVLHNTGKTKSLSIVVLWHLLCLPKSITLVTSNDMDQLNATLWKEISATVEKIGQGPFSWLYPHIFIGADNHAEIEGFGDQWFVESKTANAKTANKMAGRHGENFLVIVDEASTVPDEVFTTLTGALTEQHNRMILTSQYTRLSGYFHRTQAELNIENGGDWDAMTFSSVDSPWVSDEFLIEKLREYDDDEKRVRIFGLPPEDSSKFLLSLKHANLMYKQGRIIADDEPYGWITSSDVALGEGMRDKSTIGIGRVIGYGDKGPEARRVEIAFIPLFSNNIKSSKLAAHIVEAGADLSNVTYVVDKGGIGGTICQQIEEQGHTLIPVLWGKPCWKKENNDRYLNLRAQASHHAALAAKEGRLSILTDDHKRFMLAQASGVPKDHTANFRLKIPEKGSPAWEGRGSPDLWDMVCFFFLENVNYIVADGDQGESTAATEEVKAAADALFADVED